MGIYLNPDNKAFKESINRKIYVDKSLLIDHVNKYSKEVNKNICVSRPRRFGKSTDANMLVAYYSKGCNSLELFDSLKIAQCDSYHLHLNKHNVIHLDIQSFLSKSKDMKDMLSFLTEEVLCELSELYDVKISRPFLSLFLEKIYVKYNEQFIFVIDEWDCVFREYKNDKEAQKDYLDFLRDLFKEKDYVELVYMTGILPVKKYGTHSALNMFDEISMVQPENFSKFMGFTEEEVKYLCDKYDVDFNQMKEWYDGYHLKSNTSIYSPRSVTASINSREFNNYWSQTETFEALKDYIDLNFDGLKDDIIAMVANEKRNVNIRTFQNDMSTFHSKDDVFTLLIHLGYLGYDAQEKKVYIPNNEVKDSFIDSISVSGWDKVAQLFKNSKDLLTVTWNKECANVAKYIQNSHYETSILQYNDENALAYTIYLAYITAREYYTILRELPTGKGFADLVFIPKKDKPAMIVELKYDQTVETGITQIKNKEYPQVLEHYLDNLLLVSINYDKTTKEHQCFIEKHERS